MTATADSAADRRTPRPGPPSAFLAVAVLVLLLLHGIPWLRLVIAPGWPFPVTLAGTVLAAVALIAFPISMMAGHGRRHRDGLAEQAITAARSCPVPEINRLGRTLNNWRTEYLARFDQPQVFNGPTENLNLKIKNTKRTARGYRSFRNYRLRLLLNHGLIRQDQQTTRVRTRRPSFVA